MTLAVPAHIPWQVHRIAVSQQYADSLHTILTEWGIADVADANAVLDALEDANARAQER